MDKYIVKTAFICGLYQFMLEIFAVLSYSISIKFLGEQL